MCLFGFVKPFIHQLIRRPNGRETAVNVNVVVVVVDDVEQLRRGLLRGICSVLSRARSTLRPMILNFPASAATEHLNFQVTLDSQRKEFATGQNSTLGSTGIKTLSSKN